MAVTIGSLFAVCVLSVVNLILVVQGETAVGSGEFVTIHKCSDAAVNLSTFSVPDEFKISSEAGNDSLTFLLTQRGNNSCAGGDVVNLVLNYQGGENLTAEGLTNSGVKFARNGYLRRVNGTTVAFFSPGSYCISSINATSLSLDICEHPCSPAGEGERGNLCIRKCCPANAWILKNDVTWECVTSNSKSGNATSFSGKQDESAKSQVTLQIPNLQTNCAGGWSEMEAGSVLVNVSSDQCADEVEGRKSGVGFFSCQGQQREQPPPYQDFLYKCGSQVKEEYWIAPDNFRILYGEKKLDRFRYDLNYQESMYNFSLVQREPSCWDTFFLSTNMTTNSLAKGPNISAINFSPDGYLTYFYRKEEIEDEIYFHKERFCISNISLDSITLKVCKSACYHRAGEKGTDLCVPKCCPFGWVMDAHSKECEEVKEDWLPDVYRSRLASHPVANWTGQIKYVPVVDLQCYLNGQETLSIPLDSIRLLTNGQLYKRVRSDRMQRNSRLAWELASFEDQPFCIDAFWNSSISQPEYVVAAVCNTTEKTEMDKLETLARAELYSLRARIVVPVIFLPCVLIHLAILTVYFLLWDKQSAHGWTVMAFSSSQLIWYLSLLVIVGMGIYSDALKQNQTLCTISGIVYHFSYINTYSWTVVLSFDVWAKLSSMTRSEKASKGKKRFFMYSCFGLGVPMFLVVVGNILEWGFWEFEEGVIEMPGYSDYCIIYGKTAFFLYQGLPSVLLYAANLTFVFLTFRSLWNTKKKVEILKDKGSSKSKQSSFDNKLILVSKLMLMMGAFLIFEFLFNFLSLLELSIYFMLLESYMILHAAGLFWLFVCSKKILKQLQEKYPRVQKQLNASGLAKKFTVTETLFQSTNPASSSHGAK